MAFRGFGPTSQPWSPQPPTSPGLVPGDDPFRLLQRPGQTSPFVLPSPMGEAGPMLNAASVSGLVPSLANASVAKPSFFSPGGAGRGIAGTLGDALLQPAHMQPIYAPALEQHRREQQYQQQLADQRTTWQQQQEWELAHPKPETFTVGNDRVRYDPSNGETATIYHGPTDAELYAGALGVKPGTPEYGEALRDYVLRGNGPSALGYDLQLESLRQKGRQTLESVRQGDRMALRGSPTYAQTHPRAPTGMAFAPRTIGNVVAPIMSKVASGKPLSAGEQQVYDNYQHRRRGGFTVTPGGGAPRVPGTRENPAVVANPGDAQFLPSGTYFRDPTGTLRRKP